VFYGYAEKPSGGDLQLYGASYPTNTEGTILTETAASSSSVRYSDVFGTVNFPSVWCSDGGYSGYEMEKINSVTLKFDVAGGYKYVP
jgi:hypothetical protein